MQNESSIGIDAGGLRNEVMLVLRSAGERTVDCARAILNEVVPDAEVALIQEAPFERALRTMCEIGMNGGKTWTLSLDADVLVSVPRILSLLRLADRFPQNVFHAQPFVLDKISGTVRLAGIRLFRNATLAQASELIPKEGEQLRPESEMILRMEQQGWRSKLIPMAVGIHDYEQYYRDTYRKCFVHARKHAEWIGQFIPLWRDHRDQDADFRIAMHGMWHGLNSDESLRLDIRTLPTEIEDVLQQEGLKEKVALPSIAISAEDVERTLAESPAVIEWERRRSATIWQRLCRKCDEIGWWRIVPWSLGKGLQRMGLKVERMVTKRNPD